MTVDMRPQRKGNEVEDRVARKDAGAKRNHAGHDGRLAKEGKKGQARCGR